MILSAVSVRMFGLVPSKKREMTGRATPVPSAISPNVWPECLVALRRESARDGPGSLRCVFLSCTPHQSTWPPALRNNLYRLVLRVNPADEQGRVGKRVGRNLDLAAAFCETEIVPNGRELTTSANGPVTAAAN
jgi:hypothetical protein